MAERLKLGTQSLPKIFSRKRKPVLILACYVGFWINLVRLLEEAGKNFFSTFTIILYHIFFILSNARFQWRPGPYGACSRPRGALSAPGQSFFPFREKIDSSRGLARPDFCFEWSRLSGGRPPAPPRGPLSTKNRRIWWFFGSASLQTTQKLQKYYENVTKI